MVLKPFHPDKLLAHGVEGSKTTGERLIQRLIFPDIQTFVKKIKSGLVAALLRRRVNFERKVLFVLLLAESKIPYRGFALDYFYYSAGVKCVTVIEGLECKRHRPGSFTRTVRCVTVIEGLE